MTIFLKQFSDVPNVGDAISALIVEHITARRIGVIGEAPFSLANVIGAGSIAHWADEQSMLWGCGLINDWIEPNARPARVLAVRGRLTRDRLTGLGIACGDILGDPGFFLPELIARAPVQHALGIVPHYVDRELPFLSEARHAGIRVIDPLDSPEAFVASLTSCERILSSSLHGIILAHAYGIDAAWVRMSDAVHGEGFKFWDYYSSIGFKRADMRILRPGIHSIEEMLRECRQPAVLPDLTALRSALLEVLDEMDVPAAETLSG